MSQKDAILRTRGNFGELQRPDSDNTEDYAVKYGSFSFHRIVIYVGQRAMHKCVARGDAGGRDIG